MPRSGRTGRQVASVDLPLDAKTLRTVASEAQTALRAAQSGKAGLLRALQGHAQLVEIAKAPALLPFQTLSLERERERERERASCRRTRELGVSRRVDFKFGRLRVARHAGSGVRLRAVQGLGLPPHQAKLAAIEKRLKRRKKCLSRRG